MRGPGPANALARIVGGIVLGTILSAATRAALTNESRLTAAATDPLVSSFVYPASGTLGLDPARSFEYLDIVITTAAEH